MGNVLGQLFIDPKEFPQDGFGFFQVFFLGSVYAYILFSSSNLISDGSELLLLVPALAGIVGSVVLPVLGAVPDGAIVLFSGMGPNAQEQLSVGVGALAGSTIMLLTIPWALSVISGRVNLDADGNGNYKRPKSAKPGWSKLMPPNNCSLSKTGVVVGSEIKTNGMMMMLTALIYLVIQIPALKSTGTVEKDLHANMTDVAHEEQYYAYFGFALCTAAFLGYLVWNVVRASSITHDALEGKQIQFIRDGEISLSGLLCQEFDRIHSNNNYGAIVDEDKEDYVRVERLLKPFFKKYDANSDNRMDSYEMRLFFNDLNEDVSQREIDRWFTEADSDKSGFIEFRELVEATIKFLREKNHHPASPFSGAMQKARMESFAVTGESKSSESIENDDDEEEEEDEIPDDLAGLSVEEQQVRIKRRAFSMMAIGTLTVLLFADPMVDILSEVGTRTGIPAFYISFVVAPLASNASELIAAYNYAQKKTRKTISISIATLLGAACMNNTFCLGIFMGLMAFKGDLVWEYSAETLTILVVELIMGILAMNKTQSTGSAIFVLCIFPLSIVFVAVLENVFLLD